eukprot:jgi/Chlat1/5725/Chrsp38S05528
MATVRVVVVHGSHELCVEVDLTDTVEVLKAQIFAITGVPPENQQLLGVNEYWLQDDAPLSALRLTDLQRVMLLGDLDEGPSSSGDGRSSASGPEDSSITEDDEALARRLQAEENAAQAAADAALAAAFLHREQQQSNRLQSFTGRLHTGAQTVLRYEDLELQAKARAVIPIDELQRKAAEAVASNDTPGEVLSLDDALVCELLHWFKGFFRWIDAPACHVCSGPTVATGMGSPSEDDLRYGASRVELYRCSACGRITRFPRYNDPGKLLETRSGRCGEWANAFTLCCRSLDIKARWVMDWTDHVWTECFSASRQRWIHCDPCEDIYDRPLLYEAGWGKQLSYVVAFSHDGAIDVTRRYTRKWHEVATRRTHVTEEELQMLLARLNQSLQSALPPAALQQLALMMAAELLELQELQQTYTSAGALPGRQSGALDWRVARGEVAGSERPASDEGAAGVINAVHSLLRSHLDDAASMTSLLQTALQVVADLRAQPVKHLVSTTESTDLLHALSGMEAGAAFLQSIGLTPHAQQGQGPQSVLPPGVLITATEALQRAVRASQNERVALGRLGSRISSGFVGCSGENLPDESSICAFDGRSRTKWLDFNGHTGNGWLSYRFADNCKQTVAAYCLTSANDSPERDPADWVLEGSDDKESWTLLHEQCAYRFAGRFVMTPVFYIKTQVACRMLRLRVTRVHNPTTAISVQLARLDVYLAN